MSVLSSILSTIIQIYFILNGNLKEGKDIPIDLSVEHVTKLSKKKKRAVFLLIKYTPFLLMSYGPFFSRANIS